MPDREVAALADSRSPFLRHGAAQPVAWLPWGAAAFDRARSEDKPVLLDIGAVWCHWCHVMDRESYDDPETAGLINELFVPVKVDRDERPDVDARYQRAVQAVAGQGGWPLTAFLTPEGEVFYGGTYFPPEDGHGRPSYRRVLSEIARVWREERGRARETAATLRERLAEHDAALRDGGGELDRGLVATAVDGFARSFDFRFGGFGRAPKFPNAGALALLLDHYVDTGTDWSREIVVRTLDAMARGGVYDQLGGGFHRYSTDERWLVPHFEKMAYDNGVLLDVYAAAFAVLDRPLYGRVVDMTVACYRDLAPDLIAAGGFPASQDADVGQDDGDYWTWTPDEIRRALDGDDGLFRVAEAYFGLDDPDAAMHTSPPRRVLFAALEPEQVAERLGLDGAAAETLIRDVRRRLKAFRNRRPRPYVDETLYAGWTGLLASGHLAAARFAGAGTAAGAALRALDRVWEEGFEAGRGVAHRIGDRAAGAYLEDQAHVARAMLDAFELTQSPAYLDRARRLADVMLDRFHDPEAGMFTDRAAGDAVVGALDMPHRPILDSPEPAGNAVAPLVLLRLAALEPDGEYRHLAENVLAAFTGVAGQMATGVATYVRAVDWATGPVTSVVVVGGEGDAAADALFRTALRTYRPRSVLRRFDPDAVRAEELAPELRAMVTRDSPLAYVCVGHACAEPVSDAGALSELLKEFRG